MSIQSQLIEHLLREDEGTTLDFKREQYPFVGATKDEKSELLKDVLAFANAFRRTDAYILVGVEERRGMRSEVVGVEPHLDDASLQQFVNSRTQRAVTFSYHEVIHDNRSIGVLHIPLQERPIYARANYGKVQKDAVYLRRGSSTGTATPEEIVLMARVATIAEAVQPSAELHMVDRATGERLSQPVRAKERTWHEVPSGEDLPNYGGYDHLSNRDYYREIAAYIEAQNCLRVALEIENPGSTVIEDAKLRIELHDPDRRHELRGPQDMLDLPQRLQMDTFSRVTLPDAAYDIDVVREGDFWRVECRFGKVQPKSKARLGDDLLIGARQPGELDIRGNIHGDNIGTPIAAEFRVSFSRGSGLIAAADIVAAAEARD